MVGRGLALVVVREAVGVAGHPKRVWWVLVLPLVLSSPFLIPRRTHFVQSSALNTAHALQGS